MIHSIIKTWIAFVELYMRTDIMFHVIFQIYLISVDGKTVEAVLHSGEGIHKPTRLSVDKAGQRLVVINRSGIELRVYQILTTTWTRQLLPHVIEVYKK